MTHDKKGRFLSLHTFRDLKRLCGLASVSGYLLFAPYFPPCICLFLLLFFFFFFFLSCHDCFYSRSFGLISSLRRCSIHGSVFIPGVYPSFHMFTHFMMRYVFDVFIFNESLLYLPCQGWLVQGLFSFDDRHNCGWLVLYHLKHAMPTAYIWLHITRHSLDRRIVGEKKTGI